MANGRGTLPLAEEFIRSIAREYAWPDVAHPSVRKLGVVPPGTYEAIAGQYEVLVFWGRLFVEAPGQARFEILPESETCYFTESNAALMHTFEKNTDGVITNLLIELVGQPFSAVRVR